MSARLAEVILEAEMAMPDGSITIKWAESIAAAVAAHLASPEVEAHAIRQGCTTADIHLRCDYPRCGCKTVPAQIKAALAAAVGGDGTEEG